MNNQLFPLFLRFVNVQTEPFSSGHWFCFYLFEQKIEAIWSRSSAELPSSAEPLELCRAAGALPSRRSSIPVEGRRSRLTSKQKYEKQDDVRQKSSRC